MEKTYIPKRFKGRTGYHIFVDRFCRAEKEIPLIEGRRMKQWNDAMPDWWPDADGEYRNQYFYGGNLQGIIQKLEYFSELSIDLLYLSPISKTNTSHHYDVGDQREIDPYIGTWEDFITLCYEAHKRKMLIAVDLVFNHMGAKCEFFQKALAGEEKYRKWFEWDERGNPVYWFGFKDMPQCNKLEPSYQEYACDVVEKYVKHGADCIRLDLGENLPKEFLTKIKKRAKEINPEVLVVSEMWDFALKKGNPQIYDGQVDSLMNYPLSDAILRWVRYGNYLHYEAGLRNLAKYPANVHDVLWNHLDTHDTPRALNMLSGKGMLEDPFKGHLWDIEGPWRSYNNFDTYGFRKWESENDFCLSSEAIKRLKLAALVQYMSKGIPIVLYGTEAGVYGYKDPFNRKPYPWSNEKTEILNFYVELGGLRASNRDILADGDMYVYVDERILEIVRRNEYGIIVAVLNRTNSEQKIGVNNYQTKVIFRLNESTERILKPLGAIVYRI